MSAACDLLPLYRRLLRLQKTLSQDLATLGTQFIREEFKRHKNVEKTYLVPFIQEWKAYADTLEQQSRAGVKIGQPLSPKVIDLLSDEQVGQLCALKDEAEKSPPS